MYVTVIFQARAENLNIVQNIRVLIYLLYHSDCYVVFERSSNSILQLEHLENAYLQQGPIGHVITSHFLNEV